MTTGTNVTVYRISVTSAERTVGVAPTYVLYNPYKTYKYLCDIFIGTSSIDLSDGYKIVTCQDTVPRFEDPQERICELISNKDLGFWIMPVTDPNF